MYEPKSSTQIKKHKKCKWTDCRMLEITEPVAICDQFTTASHYILLRRIGQIAGCKEPCLSLLAKLQAKMLYNPSKYPHDSLQGLFFTIPYHTYRNK